MLTDISQLSILPALIMAVSNLTSRVKNFRLVSYVIIFMFIAQLIDSVLYYYDLPRTLFYHIYTVSEYIVLSSLLLLWEPQYKHIAAPVITAGFIAILLAAYPVDMYLESLIILLFSSRLLYFYMVYNIRGLADNICFWLSLSFFIYFLFFFLISIGVNNLVLQGMHSLVNITSNFIIAWGMYASRIGFNRNFTTHNVSVNAGNNVQHRNSTTVSMGQEVETQIS